MPMNYRRRTDTALATPVWLALVVETSTWQLRHRTNLASGGRLLCRTIGAFSLPVSWQPKQVVPHCS